MNIKKFRAKYVSEISSVFLKQGEIHNVYYPLDDPGKRLLAVYLEDMDEPGDYAVPADRFEIVEEDKDDLPASDAEREKDF